MKTKKVIVEVICFMLMLNFFYEGIHKLAYLSNYGFYVTHAPVIKPIGMILKYTVPVLEIGLAIGVMTQRFRKPALYSIIISQIVFIFWVMSVYLFTHYLFWPNHALWGKPTWMEKMSFGLGLSWMSFTVFYLSKINNKIRDKPSIIKPSESF